MIEHSLFPIGKAYDTTKSQTKFIDDATTAFTRCIDKQKISQNDDDPAARGQYEHLEEEGVENERVKIIRAIHRECRSDAHHGLANIYYNFGRWKEAITEYEAAIW